MKKHNSAYLFTFCTIFHWNLFVISNIATNSRVLKKNNTAYVYFFLVSKQSLVQKPSVSIERYFTSICTPAQLHLHLHTKKWKSVHKRHLLIITRRYMEYIYRIVYSRRRVKRKLTSGKQLHRRRNEKNDKCTGDTVMLQRCISHPLFFIKD